MLDIASPENISALTQRLAAQEKVVAQLTAERDQYKKLYMEMLELCRKLERGILGQKRERLPAPDEQLTLSVLGSLISNRSEPEPPKTTVETHERAKPTGRKTISDKLPRVDIKVLPPEVEEAGLAAFEQIGEDVSEVVEYRPKSLVVLRIHKPKFVLKDRDRLEDTKFLQAAPLDMPISGGLSGPGFLSQTIVQRWDDHLPLYRLERIWGREGLDLARSTICGWHRQLAELVAPLILAIWKDILSAPYLCIDATGVLVQDLEKCRNAHFFVVAAPEKHVLFGFSPKHNSAAVDELIGSYKGYLVADAHTVYDHLFKTGDVIESGCWSHARRYFFKALSSAPEKAHQALAFIKGLFDIEREQATSPPEVRLRVRQERAKPLLDDFFSWCSDQAMVVLDETPIAKAVTYASNQKQALMRFLEDGRLPIHNNFSERQLRREAIGRKNWLFVGSDDAGEVNATFVSLLASCQLHGIEPYAYLRDLFCLLPAWPVNRVLELAPVYWKQTLEQEHAQQKLAANPFRQASLGALVEHSLPK